MVIEEECITSIFKVVAYLLTGVFEIADSCARDVKRTKILPSDVRLMAILDNRAIRPAATLGSLLGGTGSLATPGWHEPRIVVESRPGSSDS